MNLIGQLKRAATGAPRTIAHEVTGQARTVKNVAGKATHGVKHVAGTAMHGVKNVEGKVGTGVRRGARVAGAGFNAAEKTARGTAVSGWKATSGEAKALGHAVERGGITIGHGFIAGASAAKSGLQTAVEQTGKGLVAAGKYVSQYACDIAVGTALSAAFAGLAAGGQEEAPVGALAVLAATQFVNERALKKAARSLASVITKGVYSIPGVNSAIGNKSEVENVIGFLIFKACKQNPKLVIASGGQYLAGALIYGLTSVICEGKLPGGYQLWKAARAQAARA